MSPDGTCEDGANRDGSDQRLVIVIAEAFTKRTNLFECTFSAAGDIGFGQC